MITEFASSFSGSPEKLSLIDLLLLSWFEYFKLEISNNEVSAIEREQKDGTVQS